MCRWEARAAPMHEGPGGGHRAFIWELGGSAHITVKRPGASSPDRGTVGTAAACSRRSLPACGRRVRTRRHAHYAVLAIRVDALRDDQVRLEVGVVRPAEGAVSRRRSQCRAIVRTTPQSAGGAARGATVATRGGAEQVSRLLVTAQFLASGHFGCSSRERLLDRATQIRGSGYAAVLERSLR